MAKTKKTVAKKIEETIVTPVVDTVENIVEEVVEEANETAGTITVTRWQVALAAVFVTTITLLLIL